MNPTDALAQYLGSQTGITNICVAYSAGMDSHVLLHAAASLLREHEGIHLRAIHINHGLN